MSGEWKMAPVEPTEEMASVRRNLVYPSDTDVYKAMLAAAPSPWRPMDEAPKDGTEIVLRVTYCAGTPGRALVCHFMPGGHCIEDHPPIEAGWYFWNGYMFDRASDPTGWFPIPE